MNSGLEKYKNTNVTFVGDSITYGFLVGKSFVDFIIEKNIFKSVSVSAVPGSCVSIRSDRGLIHDPLVTRLKDIPLDSDLVIFFMGTNDYKHDSPLGNMEDQEDISFIGALNYSFKYIKNNIPSAEMMYVLPIRRLDFTGPNSFNLNQLDYNEAIVKVCKKFNVPVFDGYNLIDVSEHLVDGLHPTVEGQEIIAEKIIEFLKIL